jgi:hypothetical protein
MRYTFRLADRRLLFLENGREMENRPLGTGLGREIGRCLDQTRWIAALTDGDCALCLDIAVRDRRSDEARAVLVCTPGSC